MAKGSTNSGTGGSNKSMIIVDAPSGSTVTCSNGSVTKPGVIKDGKWLFKGCDIGSWTITATHPDQEQPATASVEITEDGQMLRYYVTIAFRMTPEFSYTGDYEVVDDDDNPIADFANWKGNWKIRFLTSGDLTFTNLYGFYGNIDVFLVGGGGGGSAKSGGGGGYTKTQKGVQITSVGVFPIIVGSGGALNADGGSSSAFSIGVDGGKRASANEIAGDGGSGGGSHTDTSYAKNGNGGSDGSDGYGQNRNGVGQHTTTREFGEDNNTLYAGGGGGIKYGSSTVFPGGAGGGGGGSVKNGANNTGGGGGATGSGGSGIVIIRNTRRIA